MRRDDSGISTVLGAVLILGLLISIVAVAKIIYVPELKQQAEADHMQTALGDFMDHKTALELASIGGHGAVINTRIEMGGGDIPVIAPDRSSGTIAIDPAYGRLNVTAYFTNGSMLSTTNRTNMGSIDYASRNNYWIDQQFHYEDGMVVLQQYDGRTVLSNPNIGAARMENTSMTTIMINPIRISGGPSTVSSTGMGIISSKLYAKDYSCVSANVTNLTINVTSKYPQEWAQFFRNEFTGAGLVEGTSFTVTVSGNDVTAYVWSYTGQRINLNLCDADFYTTPGNVVISPTPTPVGPVDHFLITPSSSTVYENDVFSVTVTAMDANNNVITNYAGAVTLDESPRNNLHGTVTYTFSPADHGVHTYTGIWFSSHGDFTINADSGSITSNTLAITVLKKNA